MSLFVYALLLMLFILTIRVFIKRCYIYYYVYVDDRKERVLLGYLKRDGTIIDIHQPRGNRRVGKVYVDREGFGIVRLYDPNVEGEYREVGKVTSDGWVYEFLTGGEQRKIAKIETDGETHWWELWLRKHAEVPSDDPEPVGHCIETGRFRHARPNEITLLARGATVLLLYFQEARPPEEAAELPPSKIWDTAFPATLFYLLIFFPLRLITNNFALFPFLGRELSLVISLLIFYFILWSLFHLLKIYMLSSSDVILDYLVLLNRFTGLRRWNIFIIILSLIGCIWAFFISGYSLLPMFFVIFFGILINHIFMPSHLWPVVVPFPSRPPIAPAPTEGDVERTYFWSLDSPLRNLDCQLNLRFNEKEIVQIRKQNPFYINWEESARHWRDSALKVINGGIRDDRIKVVVNYCMQQANQFLLTKFEQLQLILDFVQEPNIQYILDEESPEIEQKPEYIRFPVETLFDKRGDCDCKAALAVALFKTMGFPVLLLIGQTHAAIAIGGAPDLLLEDVDGIFVWKGKRYYYCETTGDYWTIGKVPEGSRAMMDKNQTDVIEFY